MNILNDREMRYLLIQKLDTNHPIIVIHANIPGNDKNLRFSYFLVNLFKKALEAELTFLNVRFFESFDGPYYIIEVDGDYKKIKEKLISIEENHFLGRLVDLDVYYNNQSVSRIAFKKPLRKCLICNEEAHQCIKNQAHSVSEVLEIELVLVKEYLTQEIGEILKYSVLKEVSLENKFGLVTKTSSGSHPDMDFSLFEKSEEAIQPYFKMMFGFGFDYDLDEAFKRAREVGKIAEKAMYQATNYINTHKGLIFVLGIVLVALGKSFQEYKFDLFEKVRYIGRNLITDFSTDYQTFGQEAYHKYQMTGIRGEVMSGLENVKKVLPLLKTYSDENIHMALIRLIERVEDTVLLKRAKTIERYEYHRKLIGSIKEYDINKISEYTKICESENLSFGGSADLLVVAILLTKIEEKFNIKYE